MTLISQPYWPPYLFFPKISKKFKDFMDIEDIYWKNSLAVVTGCSLSLLPQLSILKTFYFFFLTGYSKSSSFFSFFLNFILSFTAKLRLFIFLISKSSFLSSEYIFFKHPLFIHGISFFDGIAHSSETFFCSYLWFCSNLSHFFW